ncbi:MAG: hypothetical protein IKH75_11480 [Ruminococcus sp.]|nr:hypothetical protein [Ruminococcus sp.]
MDQITIFEIIEPNTEPDFMQMTLKQIAEHIGERTGLHFIPDTRFHGEFNEYIAYYTNTLFFTVGLDNYMTGDERQGKPFISVEYECKKTHSGSGSPCDSLQEAISFFKIKLQKNKRKEKTKNV